MFTHPLKHKQQWGLFIAFIICVAVLSAYHVDAKWYWFPLYSLLVLSISPYTRDPQSFFSGGLTDKAKKQFSFLFLTSASFVAWLFAKSIQNSAALSYSFGLMGGVAYAGYYIGFWATAIVVYRLRSMGYRSFMEAIADRYGYLSCCSFASALLYRLFSEIWSNTIVVGSFYGSTQSALWWTSVWLATIIPISYVILGGQKSSLLSDLGHGTLVVIFLIVLLSLVIPAMPYGLFDARVTKWTLAGGGDQLCVAVIQGGLSYPFMDPAMTDRAFLGNKKAMVGGFFLGGLLAMTFIFLFGFIGTYGRMLTLLPAGAAQYALGQSVKKAIAANANSVTATCIGAISTVALSFTALIAVADTISTMDSCFMATAKVTGVELYGLIRYRRPLVIFKAQSLNVNIGRISIIVLAVASTLFLLQTNQIALNATNATGTVVMGLGPAIWLLAFTPFKGHRPLAFLLPFWAGAIIGIIFQATAINGATNTSSVFRSAGITIGNGNFADLLGTNLYGAIICWALYPIGYFLSPLFGWNEQHRLKALDRVLDPSATVPAQDVYTGTVVDPAQSNVHKDQLDLYNNDKLSQIHSPTLDKEIDSNSNHHINDPIHE